MSGLFAVNKPTGITSAGLLKEIQEVLSRSSLFAADIQAQADRAASGGGRKRAKLHARIKMGHGGTLDPLASGVLVVGVGKGTKQLGGFLGCAKEYEAVALFGVSTDTYDSEGKVVGRAPWRHITKSVLEQEIAAHFKGEIMQTPPIYSALKMQGKPLYEYAREGKPLPAAIKARPATVTRFEVGEVWTAHHWSQPAEEASEEIRLAADALKQLQPNTAATDAKETTEMNGIAEPERDAAKPGETLVAVQLHMTVSSGTYVRSLIHDLGLAVGSAAHMVSLVRRRVGDYTLAEALSPQAFHDGSWEATLAPKLEFEPSAEEKAEEAQKEAEVRKPNERAIEGETPPPATTTTTGVVAEAATAKEQASPVTGDKRPLED